MALVCRRLIKLGIYSLSNSVLRTTMVLDCLKPGNMFYLSNSVCWKHFSPAPSKLMGSQQCPNVKKEPVFKYVLQYDLFKYLRANEHYCTCTPLAAEDIRELLQKPINELTDDELPDYIATVIKEGLLTESLQAELDEECVSRLTTLKTDQILKLVDAWLYFLPHILNKLWFFHDAMSKFDSVLKSKITSIPVFIQTYFYVSLCYNKDLRNSIIQSALYKLQLSYCSIRTLNLDELVILCVSTYRTSNVIKSRIFLEVISDCIKTNLEILLKEEAKFVSLIKPLRPAEFCDFQLLDSIAANLVTIESTALTTKIHLLALFAESLYFDKVFLQNFANIIGHDLRNLLENKETKDIRMKDVSRLLWSLSYLGVVPEVHNVDVEVMELISDWIDKNRFDVSNFHWLVSMMNSIFIFNWKYEDLFEKVFHTFPPSELQVQNNHRNKLNLNRLISGLQIEAPHLVSKELSNALDTSSNPTVKKHLLTRILLKDARNTVWSLTKKLNLTDIHCHFNVPFMLILGISFYTPKRNLLHIEVLDSTNCLLTTNIPHGLMGLKLRLLRTLKQHVFIIDSTKLDKKSNNLHWDIEYKIREIDGNS